MKAKSIKGKTSEDIKNALAQCLVDSRPDAPIGRGYKPTIAIVFLSDVAAIDSVSTMLDAEGNTVFGASTDQKFTEDGLDNDDNICFIGWCPHQPKSQNTRDV